MPELTQPYERMMSESGAKLMELEASRSGQIVGWLMCLRADPTIARSNLMRNVEEISGAMGPNEGPHWANIRYSEKKPGQDFQNGARPAIRIVQFFMPPEFQEKMLSVYWEKFAGHTTFDIQRKAAQYDRDRAATDARQAVYDYADRGLGADETQPLVNLMQSWVEHVETEGVPRMHMRRGFGYVMQLAIDAQWQLEANGVLSNPNFDWDNDIANILGEQ